jgi:hypothetical protein
MKQGDMCDPMPKELLGMPSTMNYMRVSTFDMDAPRQDCNQIVMDVEHLLIPAMLYLVPRVYTQLAHRIM